MASKAQIKESDLRKLFGIADDVVVTVVEKIVGEEKSYIILGGNDMVAFIGDNAVLSGRAAKEAAATGLKSDDLKDRIGFSALTEEQAGFITKSIKSHKKEDKRLKSEFGVDDERFLEPAPIKKKSENSPIGWAYYLGDKMVGYELEDGAVKADKLPDEFELVEASQQTQKSTEASPKNVDKNITMSSVWEFTRKAHKVVEGWIANPHIEEWLKNKAVCAAAGVNGSDDKEASAKLGDYFKKNSGYHIHENECYYLAANGHLSILETQASAEVGQSPKVNVNYKWKDVEAIDFAVLPVFDKGKTGLTDEKIKEAKLPLPPLKTRIADFVLDAVSAFALGGVSLVSGDGALGKATGVAAVVAAIKSVAELTWSLVTGQSASQRLDSKVLESAKVASSNIAQPVAKPA